MAKIGSLTADMKLRSAAFQRDMAKSAKAVQSNTAKMNKSLRSVRNSSRAVVKSFNQVRAGAGALAGALAVRQFTQFTKGAIEFADVLAKQADGLGLTTQALQEYRGAAALAGIETKRFDKGIERFVRNVGDAREGTGALVTLLKKMDAGFLETLTLTTDTDQALALMLKRLSEAEDAFERGALAAAAFGREGVKFAKIVREGGGNLRLMRDRAIEMGLVLREDVARAAENVNDRMTLLQTSFETAFNTSIIETFANAFQLTKENFEAAQLAGERFGTAVGKSMLAVAKAAEFVARNIQLITTVMATLIALKAASFFVAGAAAVVKFARALLIAAKSGAILNLIISKSVIGALVKMAIATSAAAASWKIFSKEAGGAVKAVEKEMSELISTTRQTGTAADKAATEAALAFAKEQVAVKALISDLEFERSLISATNREREIAINLRRAGASATEAQQKSIRDLTGDLISFREAQSVAAGSVRTFLGDLREGKSAAEAFDNALQGVIDRLLDIVADQVATQIISGFFRGAGASGGLSGGGGLDALAFHRGGIVGRTGGENRRLPLGTFAHAPRLHNGLAPDEFPAVLQRGERVTAAGADPAVGSPKFEFNVLNFTGQPVETREQTSPGGGRRIDAIIGEMAAEQTREFGSPLNKSIRSMGGTQGLITR